MRIWTANLGRGVSTAEFEVNLDRLLDAAGPNAFLFLQEIDEADAPNEMVMLRYKTQRTHVVMADETSVPILVPIRYADAKFDVTLACKGLAKVTPRRVVTEVRVKLGPRLWVTLLNTHLPVLRARSLTRRARVRRTLRRRAEAARARGDAVVWAADTNTHTRFPRIAAGEVNVINAGIDKARASAPKGRTEVTERRDVRLVNLSIDRHDAHGARVWFKKEK